MVFDQLQHPIASAVGTIILAWVLLVLGKAVYNVYFHTLSGFPGPIFRAVSSVPILWETWTGRSVQTTNALHQKYGRVVRNAPDSLSFSSAQAWKDIYGFRQQKRQVPKDYKRVPPGGDVLPIMFSTDSDHARMRKLMSHAFSDAALKGQLSLVASHMEEFIHRVRARSNANANGELDINEWFNYLAFDIVTDLSFGESLSCIQRESRDSYIDGVREAARLFFVVLLIHEFTIVRLLYQMLMKIPAIKQHYESAYYATKEKVERRMAHERREKQDFMTYILRYNDEKGMSKSEITGSTTVIVNAGGETTASWMGGAVYFLLKNPETYKRARAEVRSAFKSTDEIMSGSPNLVYLNAVIEECLRIYPPAPGNFARRTNMGTEIDGFLVPANTSVGVHQWSANHSTDNFAQPEHFIPERWLSETPSECQNDVKAAMQPWAIGPRNCLGKNVAYLEIRMVLALLLWLFDMELCPKSDGWIERQKFNIIWDRPPLYIRLLPRTA